MDHKNPRRLYLYALIYFITLTFIITWPLVTRFTDHVPGWFVADNYEYLWKMWWFKHALVNLNQSPLFAPHIFYPSGFPLAHAELSPLITLVGLPVTWAWGEIPSYNLFAILSFVVTGWATFALVQRLTGSTWGGLLAGTLFALTPYHTVRYGGILPSMSIQGLPVFFLGLEMWVQEHRLRWVWVAALGFVLAGWGYLYYAVGLVLLAPVYAWYRLRPLGSVIHDPEALKAAGVFTLVALTTHVPLLIPYLQLRKEIPLKIPLDEVDFWSASPTDYILPAGLHPLWGTIVQERLLSIPPEYPQIALEFVLGVGFLTLLFAFYGWKFSKLQAKEAVLWLTAVAVVLSFGPRLHLGRHPVVIPAPDTMVTGFHALMNWLGAHLPAGETYQALETDGVSIPLPALFVRWFLPILRGMRAWNRFAVFASLGLTVLAGFGYAAWEKRELLRGVIASKVAQRIQLAGIITLGLAIFELWPGAIPLQPVEPRPVDIWLAEQPGQNIMELPLVSALSAPQMQYTRYHGKNIAFAYGTYFPIWYRQQFPELKSCPSSQCIARLRFWEVDYVLLNHDAISEDKTLAEALAHSSDLNSIAVKGNIEVYRLLPEPTPMPSIIYHRP